MRQTLLLIITALFIIPFAAKAQPIDGEPLDSAYISFNSGSILGYIADTAAVPLWQIGHSRKSFFGIDTTGPLVMLTDSVNYYPVNANNSFTIKVKAGFNTIIDFWHRFQTDSAKDGGIVEFSLDHGATWQNVKGDCNSDSLMYMHGVRTSGFYTFADTLASGQPAFSGGSTGTQYSRLQFFNGIPLKSTFSGTGCTFSVDTFYVRFRFLSDTTADTLAGWQIDSIKVENDKYYGAVAKVSQNNELSVFPNPSATGQFFFPALQNAAQYTIDVFNTMGQKIKTSAYHTALDLSQFSKGMYFYKVSGGDEYYSGRLLIE